MPWFNLSGFNTTPSISVPLPPQIQSALTPNYVAARAAGQNPVRAAVTATGEGLASSVKTARGMADKIKANLWLILLGALVIGYLLLKRK